MGTQESIAGGMFVRNSNTRVPLTGVQIEVVGSGAAARVSVRQRYINTEQSPIEAVYSFPLEEGSAVCELIVEIGGRKLLGRIEEREKAFEQYDEAMAAGNGAFLADQDRPNIFTMSVGNLLPGQEAIVCLGYVTELEQHGDSVRIMLPTTISPRYVPQPMLESADPAELERINPPTVRGPVPYGLSLTVEYTAPQGVTSVACPSHPARVEIEGNQARVELMGSAIQLDRDFVLNVALARPFDACAVLTRDGDGAHAMMVNLYPDLKQFARQPSEFIFLLDRSGSMEGDSIAQALNALRLALRSMDEGDTFNIVGFGSDYELMFPESRPYTQASLDEATNTLEGWDADLGGTELLKPLQQILNAGQGTLARQVMLLTDGQVANEAECIAAAAGQSGSMRIFTFGIGHSASEFLVKGLARACGGKAEFIHPNERIEPIVMRQFRRAAAPYLRNVRLDWGGLEPELVAPELVPALFDGDRFTVYARVGNSPASGSAEVAVLADGPKGSLRFPLNLDFNTVTDRPMVPVLMARSAIRELEEGRSAAMERGSNQRARKKDDTNSKVLELALKYQILSSQTSFIAVEERAEGTQSERAQLRRVPVALTQGWGGGSSEGPCLALSASNYGAGHMNFPACERNPGVATPDTDAYPGHMDCAGPPMLARGSFKLKRTFDAVRGRIGKRRGVGSDGSQNPEPMSADSQLMRLTMAQHADGSFLLDDTTLKIFGLDRISLESASRSLGRSAAADSAVHTAVALALLARHFSDRQDEWRMLADKAQRWLEKQALKLPDDAASWAIWAAQVCGIE
ncbi:MAG: VWA domain-containing protein [Gammaproteobacteria bacterium]|nr:VWA domain-containing protein [Gammaproteobacteria bacterium]